MYRLALALLSLAATPASAAAAPFGELAPLTVKAPARCLRATGAPGEVVRWAPGGADLPHVALGMQDDGSVTALRSADGPKGSRLEQLFAAVAAPGAPFGSATRLSAALEFHRFSVTVAPDGRALVVFDEGAHSPVLERPPGGAFAKVAEIGDTDTLLGGLPAVSLRPDGSAIVAWLDLPDLQAHAIRRTGPGPFGRPEKVGAKPVDAYAQELAGFDGGAPAEDDGRAARAAFAVDGRPVFTWAAAHTLGGLTWTAATIATFPGGVQALSGPLRDADSVTPVILPDGRPAIAWSDVSTGGDDRLHLAIEGAPAAPPPAAPAVRIGRIVEIRHGLAVPFRCSAACDVRATVPDGISGRHSLRAAGSGRLEILPDFEPIMLRRASSVPVQVLSGAPGARTVRRRSVTARLRVPRLPRLLGLSAVRHGKTIVVRWHTDRPLRKATIIAVASDDTAPGVPFFGTTVAGAGRTRFRTRVGTLLGKRYVQLFLLYTPAATERRIAVVRVTP